ncbi:hypothetical protein CIB48_g5906, partial [Xylaria polymorpha]
MRLDQAVYKKAGWGEGADHKGRRPIPRGPTLPGEAPLGTYLGRVSFVSLQSRLSLDKPGQNHYGSTLHRKLKTADTMGSLNLTFEVIEQKLSSDHEKHCNAKRSVTDWRGSVGRRIYVTQYGTYITHVETIDQRCHHLDYLAPCYKGDIGTKEEQWPGLSEKDDLTLVAHATRESLALRLWELENARSVTLEAVV